MKEYTSSRLIKNEDLNHHDTLFAGKMAMWFIENGFISANRSCDNNFVCLKCEDFLFYTPFYKGDILNINSKVVYAGNTSIIVYGYATKNNDSKICVDGFLTFVCVDKNGQKKAHNIKIDKQSKEENIKIQNYITNNLLKRNSFKEF